MARTAIDYDTRTKTARLKLEPRPKPYNRQIAPGRLLGYLRRADTAGSWMIAEKRDGWYKTRVLGLADDLARADGADILTFEQALEKVTKPHALAAAGKLTVKKALDNYFVALAARSKHAAEYRRIADKRIVPELGEHRLDRLTKTQIEHWFAGLVREDPEDVDARRRSQDTANRLLTILKAALNAAFEDEANNILTDAAWRRVKPFRDVHRSREDDLEPRHVRGLIAKAAHFDLQFANLIEAGYLTGARMGKLAGASVRDFDRTSGTLQLDGKTGRRVVTLSAEGTRFFSRLAKGRTPNAALLPKSNGERWARSAGHQRLMKRALQLAQLPETASFYTLRHAHISSC